MSSNRRRRYAIFHFDPEASARFALTVFERAGIQGALIGTARTWPELPPSEQLQTKDLDFAIREEDAVWLEKALNDMGISHDRSGIGGVCVALPGQGVKVDFLDRRVGLSGLFREAIEASGAGDRVEIGDVEVEGVPIEYVVAMKLVPAREKDDRVLDALLRVAELDYPRAREIVRRHLGIASVNRLDAMARRAGRKVEVEPSDSAGSDEQA